MQQKFWLVMPLTRVRAGLPSRLLAPCASTLHSEHVPLTTPERLFVEQRRSRKTFDLYILPVVLLVLVAAWGAMFVWWPLAVNPKAVWGAAESGEISCGSGTLSTYATGATVLANALFALLGAIVVLRIAWASTERRYLRVIEKLEHEAIKPAPVAGVAPASASEVRQ